LTSTILLFFGKTNENERNVKVNKNLKNNNYEKLNKNKINCKRAGVSPVIATTMIMAITVVMGLALYSFTSSQTNVATKSFADEATDYINYKNDRFTVTGLAFKTNSNPQQFTAYLFNNGDRVIKITDAVLSVGTDSSALYKFCTNDGTIASKDLKGILFESCDSIAFPGFQSDTPAVYQVKILSENGAFQTYFQKYNQTGSSN
jgi:FlaG/FlaF family flagellin (archaellin)